MHSYQQKQGGERKKERERERDSEHKGIDIIYENDTRKDHKLSHRIRSVLFISMYALNESMILGH